MVQGRKEKTLDEVLPAPGASEAILDTLPAPPEHIGPVAKREFIAACNYLIDRGMLHAADIPTIEARACAIAMMRRLENEAAAMPLLVTEDGIRVTRLLAQMRAAVAALSAQLCMTPSARQRLPRALQRDPRAARDEHSDAWKKALK